MNNLKLLRYDLINGIWYRKIYFILPVVLGFISCIGAHSTLLQIQEYHNNIGNGTVMDYWIYLIQGSKPYKFDVFSTFETPIRWLCFYLLFLICLNNYPNQDINSFGIHIFGKFKEKSILVDIEIVLDHCECHSVFFTLFPYNISLCGSSWGRS